MKEALKYPFSIFGTPPKSAYRNRDTGESSRFPDVRWGRVGNDASCSLPLDGSPSQGTDTENLSLGFIFNYPVFHSLWRTRRHLTLAQEGLVPPKYFPYP